MGTVDWKDGRVVPEGDRRPTNRASKVNVARGPAERDIVLFGGTFDPPHIGHLLMAQLTLERAGADEVWFLPAPVPPHKLDESHVGYHTRVKMVSTLIQGTKGLFVSDIESSLAKPSYTVDTIEACKNKFPVYRFRFLIGSDSLATLPTWHEAERLVEQVEFLVAARAGYPINETLHETMSKLPYLRAKRLDIPMLDVSSTFVRDRIQKQLPLCGLVPEDVLKLWDGAVLLE